MKTAKMSRKTFVLLLFFLMLVFFVYTEEIQVPPQDEFSTKMNFSKTEFLADYDQLWKVLEENYYFFPVLESRGVDVEFLKESTRIQLEEEVNDLKGFQSLLSSMFWRLDHYFAHLNLVDYNRYQQYMQHMRSTSTSEFDRGYALQLQREQTQKVYTYLKENDESNEGNAAEYPEVTASYDSNRKAVTFHIPTFEWDTVERDKNVFANYLLSHDDVEHIIFDISGNDGGYLEYVLNILELFGGTYECTNWLYLKDTDLIRPHYFNNGYDPQPIENIGTHPIPEFVTELGLTHYMKLDKKFSFGDPILPKHICEAKRWLIIGERTYSMGEYFASFCKQTGWATLVGKPTGGDGKGFSPIIYSLPNTGLLIQFSAIAKENEDGTLNTAEGTKPDIPVKPLRGETAITIIEERIDQTIAN